MRCKRILAAALTLAMVCSLGPVAMPAEAAAKAPALKAAGTSLKGTASATLTVQKNSAKKLIKTTWSVNKEGKSFVKLSNQKAGSVKVTAKNKTGAAIITAKVKYQQGKKTKTVTLMQQYVTTTTQKPKEEEKTSVLVDVKSPEWVSGVEAAKDAKKLVVVAALKDDATDGWFSYHEKNADGTWNMKLTTPAFIGLNGLGKTKEGDLKTPVGAYKFNRAFGIADDPGCAIPYKKVTQDDYWSGDVNYKYNELVDINDYPALNKDDSEHIIDYTYHYQYCLNISYNDQGTPGLGSAIFLHCYGPVKPYSGGCVAIPESHMKQFMQMVDEDTVIVIDSAKNLFDSDWPTSFWPENPNNK